MLRAAFPALDLLAVLQIAIVLLLTLPVALFLVKHTASRYFDVDASFEASSSEYEPRRGGMSIGGGEGREGGGAAAPSGRYCATCGKPGNNRCSRCKSVHYCSKECQSEHWKADHKFECKALMSSEPNKVDIISRGNGSCRRRKLSGFSSISLVPARGTHHILQKPQKILFPYNEFVKLFNWDNLDFPPCGLVNCGNSCFANVVLQCLACTRPLVAYLLERDHIRECVRKQNDWCFLCELQVHIKRASQSQHPFSPINILSRLPNIGGNLGYGRQEDAHEFMRFAIDTMQSVCLDEFGGEKVLDPNTQETTFIQYIFGGLLQSQVTCTKCNTISNRYENMMDLTVEIHGDAESLEECLDQFTMKEWLDGENKYKCDGCNDYVKAWKRLTVHQAPNILTIALKRFQSGRFGKLNKRITFPENLNLTPYMSGSSDGTDLYTLYAVVVHVDMLNASFFGHYICYTRDKQGRWYRIDDCKVTEVEVDDVLSEGAYMLLYSRASARSESVVKHVQPQKTKQLVEAPMVAGSSSVSCEGSDSHIQANHCEFSSLRDMRNKRKSLDDVDPTEDKCVDVMVPNGAVAEKSVLINKDHEEKEFLNPSSSACAKCPEDGNASLSSMLNSSSMKSMQLDNQPESSATEAENDKYRRPCTSFDAGSQTVENNEDNVLDRCLSTTTTANTVVSEPSRSKHFLAESHHPAETCSSLDSASEANNVDKSSPTSEKDKATPSSWENKWSSKADAKSSNGFLDEPARLQSLDSQEEKQNNENSLSSVEKENGQSNGCYQIELTKEETPNKTTDGIPGDLSFTIPGFLQEESYIKSLEKERGAKKIEGPHKATCNGSNEHSSENANLRSPDVCCNGSSFAQTNSACCSGSEFPNENRNDDCKDGPQTPLAFEKNHNIALGEKLQPLSACLIEHKRLNKSMISDSKEEND